MRQLGLVLVFIFVWISVRAHDIKMGTFDFYISEGEYRMDIRLDRADLLKCIQNNFLDFTERTDSHTLEKYIADYLASNLAIEIDGHCVTPVIQSIMFGDDFITISTDLDYFRSEVSSIKVSNTCLLETVAKQTNIMKFVVNNRSRSFRLDADRTSTVVQY